MQIRKAVASGLFYPDTKQELKQSIRNCFEHSLGAGRYTDDLKKGDLKEKAYLKEKKQEQKGGFFAAISPHAGYPFSGMCASHVYLKIKEAGAFDTIIILGFSHAGLDFGKLSTTLKYWQTPFGILEPDKKIIKSLLDTKAAYENNSSLQQEHSIEVQIPFIQYIYQDNNSENNSGGNAPLIVPISVPHSCDFRSAAKKINKCLDESKKKFCIIASSDFTHFGLSFDFLPFEDNIKDNIKKLDMGAIERILNLDSNGFLDYVNKTSATICGKSAIALLIEMIKEKACKGELLKYYTSGDITGDYEHSVSYAAISFNKKQK